MPGSHLQQFSQHLQEWELAVDQGAAALAALQRVYAELQPNNVNNGVPPTLDKLLELAPSFRLASYVGGLQHKDSSSDPGLSAAMHAAYTSLQGAVATAQEELSSMQEVADACAWDALAEPLMEPTVAGLSALQLASDPACEAEGLCGSAATERDAAAAGHPVQDDDSSAIAQPPPPHGEELALLLSAVVAALQQELHWMELAARSISLSTTAEDISTIMTFWDLQPFTDEAALAHLKAAAAGTGQG